MLSALDPDAYPSRCRAGPLPTKAWRFWPCRVFRCCGWTRTLCPDARSAGGIIVPRHRLHSRLRHRLAGFCTAFGSLSSHVNRWDPTETWGTVHDPHRGTWTAFRAPAPTVFRTATPKVGTVSISLMPSRTRPWRGLPATVSATQPKRGPGRKSTARPPAHPERQRARNRHRPDASVPVT